LGFCSWPGKDTLVDDVSVRELRSGRVIARVPVHVDEPVALDDWDRGMVFLALLRIPSALDASNYDRAGRSARPFAAAAASRALCAELDLAFFPLGSRVEDGGDAPPPLRPPAAGPDGR